MLLEGHLGNKLTDALDLDQIDDVHLMTKLIRGVFVTLKFSHSAIEPVLAIAAA